MNKVIKNPNFKNKREFEKSLISKGVGAKDWLTTHIGIENLGNKKFRASVGVGHRVFFDKVDGEAKKNKLTFVIKDLEFLKEKDYILMQSAKCCVEVHPEYAKYFDVQHEEVRLEKECWVVERLINDEWVEINSYDPKLSTEEIENGIKVVSNRDTDFGLLTIEYIQRDGRFLKHNITFKNDLASTETFRVLQRWIGVNGDKINGNKITEKTDIKGNTFVFGNDSNSFKIKESSVSLEQQGVEDVLEITTGNRKSKKEEMKRDGLEIITQGLSTSMYLDGKGIMDSGDMSRMVASVKKCPKDSRVFIGGLGLGMILLPLAISRKAKEVIVCEIDNRVIDFIGPRVKAWFKKRYPDFNFTIIQGDATKEVANHGKFDWIFIDFNEATPKELYTPYLTEKGEYTNWFEKNTQTDEGDILYLGSVKADIDSRGLKADFTYENWVLGQGDSLTIDPDTATLNNPTEDGYIRTNIAGSGSAGACATAGLDARNNTAATIIFGSFNIHSYHAHRAYVEWDISALAGKVVDTNPVFKFDGNARAAATSDIYPITEGQPSVVSDVNLFAYIATGTPYVDPFEFDSATENQSQDLGATAKTDLQTALTASQSWFAIGLFTSSECTLTTGASINSEDDATPVPPPTLEFDFSEAVSATGNFFQLF